MRCFFHIIHVGGQVDDDEGSLLDSLEQAKDVAQTTLQDLIAQAVTRGHPWTVTGIRICSDVSELAVILMDPVVEKVLRNTSDK